MEEDSSNNLNMLQPSTEQNECECHSVIKTLSTSELTRILSTSPREFAPSVSPDDSKPDGDPAHIFVSFENSLMGEIPCSGEPKKEENGSVLNVDEINTFQINPTSDLSFELPPFEGSDKGDIKNVEIPPSRGVIDNGSLRDYKVTKVENLEKNKQEVSNQVDSIMKNNSVKIEPQNNTNEVNQSKEHIGRCVDFIKRDMMNLVLKMSRKQYKIKDCQIHLTSVKEEETEDEGREEENFVIEQGKISSNVEEIERFVNQGYKSYNSKLREELTSDADIEYIDVDVPQTPESSQSSSAIIHQHIKYIPKRLADKDKAGSSDLKTSPAVSPNTNGNNNKMKLKTLPPHLHKAIVESMKSFSTTDPNLSVPQSIPVQTIIPFKESQASKESNGYIVVTTGVIQRGEPIYYLSKDIALKDVFGSNVFTVVSHSLQSKIKNQGTLMVTADPVVSPPTSPGHVGTLNMTSLAAQSLLITKSTGTSSAGTVSPPQVSPGEGSSTQVSHVAMSSSTNGLSPVTIPSPTTEMTPLPTNAVQPIVMPLPQNEVSYQVSSSTETSPAIRKRGRPPGKVQKKELPSPSFDGNKVTASTQTSTKCHKVTEKKVMDKSEDNKENGVHHCRCCTKNEIPHHDVPSTSIELSVVKDVKPMTTMVDCDDCGKSYKPETNHKCIKKKAVKVEEKKFSCPECGRTFSRKAHLNNHTRSHKTYMNTTVKCEFCKVRFKKGLDILKHREEFHPETLSTCILCDKKFPSQKLLDQHQKIHQQIDDFPSIVRCVFCNGSFDLKYYESNHAQNCSKNPNKNVSRTDGCIKVSMAKQVAIRSKLFTESISSDDEAYEQVEILEEYEENLLASSSKELKKRKRNETYSQSESEIECEEPLPKKLKHTAFRSLQSESSQSSDENNYIYLQDIDTDAMSIIEDDAEERGSSYFQLEEADRNDVDVEEAGRNGMYVEQAGTNYIDVEETARDVIDVEEMMNYMFAEV